jgi:hypothetical protein
LRTPKALVKKPPEKDGIKIQEPFSEYLNLIEGSKEGLANTLHSDLKILTKDD